MLKTKGKPKVFNISRGTRPQGYKTFLCSNQRSTKFQLLIKLKYQHMKKFLALCFSDVIFIMLINVKMPTIVGILTFISIMKFHAQLS